MVLYCNLCITILRYNIFLFTMGLLQERFRFLQEAKGVRSIRALEIICGLPNGYIGKAKQITEERAQQIQKAYPDLNMGWLLTGEGTMLKGQQPQQYNSPHATMVNGNNNVVQSHNTYDGNIPNIVTDKKTAPLVPIALAKRENVDLYKVMREPNLQAEHITRVNTFDEIDFYYNVCDDAMMPTFVRGDILALRHLEQDMYIVNGNPYILDTKSRGLILRVLKEREDKYECSALGDKERYETFNVPKDDVFRVYRIKGLLRISF